MRRSQVSIDCANEEEWKGVVDDPDDMLDNLGGCAGHSSAQTRDTPVCKDETSTSASCNCSDEDSRSTDPMRPLRDPAGAMGDDEPHPDGYGVINAHLFPPCSPFFMCCMIHIYSRPHSTSLVTQCTLRALCSCLPVHNKCTLLIY